MSAVDSRLARVLQAQYTAYYKNPHPNLLVVMDEKSINVWYFLVVGLPAPYQGGEYIFRLTAPPEFPHRPPRFEFITQNGVFAPGGAICISIGEFHESQAPGETGAYGWRASLGMVGFAREVVNGMLSPDSLGGGIRVLNDAATKRKSYAKLSRTFNGGQIQAAKFEEIVTMYPDIEPCRNLRAGRGEVVASTAAGKPEIKPAVESATEAKARPEAKPEVEVKPEVKPEVKLDNKLEDKIVETKIEVAPAASVTVTTAATSSAQALSDLDLDQLVDSIMSVDASASPIQAETTSSLADTPVAAPAIPQAIGQKSAPQVAGQGLTAMRLAAAARYAATMSGAKSPATAAPKTTAAVKATAAPKAKTVAPAVTKVAPAVTKTALAVTKVTPAAAKAAVSMTAAAKTAPAVTKTAVSTTAKSATTISVIASTIDTTTAVSLEDILGDAATDSTTSATETVIHGVSTTAAISTTTAATSKKVATSSDEADMDELINSLVDSCDL